jgi:cyclase
MRRVRVIPTLLLKNNGLVKSVRFKNYKYVGDPINTVKLFNEKEVDELVIVDIDATLQKQKPAFDRIAEIASEAFMPIAYGGGIKELDDIKRIFHSGVEKVILNSACFTNPKLITEAAKIYGSQSIVASIDAKKNILGQYKVYINGGQKNTSVSPAVYAKQMEELGAGEIMLTAIDRDGTYEGYDISLLKSVTSVVDLPVIASGGAGKIQDFVDAIKNGGASALAAASMLVFQRPHQAVLVSYPSQEVLIDQLFKNI